MTDPVSIERCPVCKGTGLERRADWDIEHADLCHSCHGVATTIRHRHRHRWHLLHRDRDYAHEHGDPVLGTVEATTKEAAETRARTSGPGL